MKKQLIRSILILIAISFFVLWWVNSPRGMLLKTQDQTFVFSTEEDAIKWPRSNALKVLPAGETVKVLKCSYGKDYRMVKVQLSDLREGFISEGRYSLLRKKKR